jgi:uncharacterized protein (DUF433 family)
MSKVAERTEGKSRPIIVSDESVMSGSPRIADRRIRVLDVFLRYQNGDSPEEIAEAFDLGLDQVHAALSYYFGNKEELGKELEDREEVIEESRNKHGSKI